MVLAVVMDFTVIFMVVVEVMVIEMVTVMVKGTIQWVPRFNPFRAPEPLPILNESNVVPKNGFPVVKG